MKDLRRQPGAGGAHWAWVAGRRERNGRRLRRWNELRLRRKISPDGF